MTSPQQWVTHSGKFHADDALAYAMLRVALGNDHRLVRTRDAALIQAADIAWDVGGIHDAAGGRFDHHQRGAPHRPDGTPYSAAGLVWRHHGGAVVAALYGDGLPPDLLASMVAAFDTGVVHRVDCIDNGVQAPEDSIGLSDLVDDFNPVWDSPAAGDPEAEDRAFLAASLMVEGILRRRLEAIRARVVASGTSLVARAAENSADPRVLELERKMPWKEAAFACDLPVLYAVFPVPGGNWMVDAMPPEPGSYAQRLPLPAAWAGLRDAELAAVSGVPDAVFVHPNRFIGAAGSKAGAMAMASGAIAIGDAAEAGR